MKNKIINLHVPLFDLDGKEVEEDLTLGKLLATDLINGSDGDSLKMFDWAMKFHKGEIVELDRSDYEKLKEFVKSSKRLTILSKAQILPLLENDKE